ncbi:MAG: nucleotidyltransferase family protein [Rhodospirillales bacterium]|nr:nucleotidyltransferase family protein [Rhodospirillales bacterium]
MSHFKPDHAFVLAAGMGARMRPLTNNRPKPMIEIAGKPMIDHALDHLTAAGVKNVTVNLHYKGDILESHLKQRPAPVLTFSREEPLLDTGGGLKKGLPTMGGNPFFVVSGDSIWENGPGIPALERMAAAWDPENMDILLLLQPVETMTLTTPVGDYHRDGQGRLTRARDQNGAYMWTSIRICKPSVFENTPNGPFSFLDILDRTQEQGRLYGLVHDGTWHHISTPEDVERVNAALTRENGA